MIINNIYFLAILLPVSALAAEFCEPLALLQSKVTYCDQNTAYAAPAKSCRDRFRAQVNVKNAEIQKILASNVKNAKGGEQSTDFQTTQTVLASAEAALTSLIAHGKSIYSEVDAYSEDFVLPVYEGYEQDFDLDPHDPRTQKQFREHECYGEPMEDLDAVKKDIQAMVDDLERTKQKIAHLHLLSKTKEASLGSLNSSAGALDPTRRQTVGSGSPSPATGNKPKGKRSTNNESTITGVEEERLKAY